MSSSPNYASVPLAQAISTGTSGTAAAGTVDGIVIEAVLIKASATTVAGKVIFTLTNGVTSAVVAEVAVYPITVSASVPGFFATVPELAGLTLTGTGNVLSWTSNNSLSVIVQRAGL